MIRRNGYMDDPAESVGRVLSVKREALLRAYRDRLLREDLEDCLSQAALELVARARRDALAGDRHIANALEQKFVSRIIDRERMIRAGAISLAPREATHLWLSDSRDADRLRDSAATAVDPSEVLAGRQDLERIHEVAGDLTDDQRLVLACQVSLGMESGEFCERFGWSAEKFRKVAQRARARLRVLMNEYELGERCARLEDDLLAFVAGTASGHRALMVRRHLANCVGCTAFVRELRLASGRVAAVLPIPPTGALAGAGVMAKLAALLRAASGAPVAPGAATIAKGAAAAALGVVALVAGGHALGGHGRSAAVAVAGGSVRTPRVAVAEPAPPRRLPGATTAPGRGTTPARTRPTRRPRTIAARRPAAASTPRRTTPRATPATRAASLAAQRPARRSAGRRHTTSTRRPEFGVE